MLIRTNKQTNHVPGKMGGTKHKAEDIVCDLEETNA